MVACTSTLCDENAKIRKRPGRMAKLGQVSMPASPVPPRPRANLERLVPTSVWACAHVNVKGAASGTYRDFTCALYDPTGYTS